MNLGGGEKPSDIDLKVLDANSTPLGGSTFIGSGETRTVALDLEPGKYFVEVAANEGFGDSYALTPEGGPGAFGTYAQIAGRCATAESAAKAERTKLGKATAKLSRTTARLRRSRYGTRAARASARAAQGKGPDQGGAERAQRGKRIAAALVLHRAVGITAGWTRGRLTGVLAIALLAALGAAPASAELAQRGNLFVHFDGGIPRARYRARPWRRSACASKTRSGSPRPGSSLAPPHQDRRQPGGAPQRDRIAGLPATPD
jgi:hypothetical protein